MNVKLRELELIQSHMAQKPVLRGEVGCACVAREVSVERGGKLRINHTDLKVLSAIGPSWTARDW